MGCPRQVDGGQMFVLESESPSLVRTIRWPGSLPWTLTGLTGGGTEHSPDKSGSMVSLMAGVNNRRVEG